MRFIIVFFAKGKMIFLSKNNLWIKNYGEIWTEYYV